MDFNVSKEDAGKTIKLLRLPYLVMVYPMISENSLKQKV